MIFLAERNGIQPFRPAQLNELLALAVFALAGILGLATVLRLAAVFGFATRLVARRVGAGGTFTAVLGLAAVFVGRRSLGRAAVRVALSERGTGGDGAGNRGGEEEFRGRFHVRVFCFG